MFGVLLLLAAANISPKHLWRTGYHRYEMDSMRWVQILVVVVCNLHLNHNHEKRRKIEKQSHYFSFLSFLFLLPLYIFLSFSFLSLAVFIMLSILMVQFVWNHWFTLLRDIFKNMDADLLIKWLYVLPFSLVFVFHHASIVDLTTLGIIFSKSRW